MEQIKDNNPTTRFEIFRKPIQNLSKIHVVVANLLVFHNIVTLSRALDRLQADGLKTSAQAMAALTPYQTEHINRFGNYTVNFSRTPEPPPDLRQSEGHPLVDHIGS
jgi:hypothetical protein